MPPGRRHWTLFNRVWSGHCWPYSRSRICHGNDKTRLRVLCARQCKFYVLFAVGFWFGSVWLDSVKFCLVSAAFYLISSLSTCLLPNPRRPLPNLLLFPNRLHYSLPNKMLLRCIGSLISNGYESCGACGSSKRRFSKMPDGGRIGDATVRFEISIRSNFSFGMLILHSYTILASPKTIFKFCICKIRLSNSNSQTVLALGNSI